MSEHAGVGLAEVQRLGAAGLLAPERHLAAAMAVRDGAAWDLWAKRALLALGAGQLLAGIVFFFAWNWADLPPFAKFSIVEGGIALAAIAAVVTGFDRPAGQASLIAASVLTGVLLAVIGQVYQTGADAWTLFAAWTVLILPWAIASRAAMHWLVWLVVLYLALGLYAEQVLRVEDWITSTRIQAALGLLTIGFIGVREVAVAGGIAWLAPRWTRRVLVFAAGLLLFWPAAGYLLYFARDSLVLLVFLPALAMLLFVYARVLPDLATATMALGFASLLLIALGFHLIEETIGFTWKDAGRALFTLGLMVGWSVAVTAGTAWAIQRLRQRMAPPALASGATA